MDPGSEIEEKNFQNSQNFLGMIFKKYSLFYVRIDSFRFFDGRRICVLRRSCVGRAFGKRGQLWQVAARHFYRCYVPLILLIMLYFLVINFFDFYFFTWRSRRYRISKIQKDIISPKLAQREPVDQISSLSAREQ